MSAFTKTMGYIGDLDDSFYDDERQRDVWNEASAVGFQLFIWATLIAAAILPWVASTSGGWVALGLLVAFAVISNLTLAYSKAKKVDLQVVSSMVRPRVAASMTLYFVGAIGTASVLVPGLDSDSSTRAGLVVGGIVGGVIGLAAAAFGLHRARRRHAALDAADDI